MNVCPYANESVTCGLLSPEVDGRIAYCKQCSQFAFRCTAGHWNRAFARYCTHCSQELEKPAQWGMASGNPQRTATLPQMPSIDSLNHDGFGSWAANIPKIESGENLPGLLAIDGFIVLPNPRKKKLDAFIIVNDSDQKNLNLRWSISYNSKLTYGSTPIYHGLHLYSVVSGGIQKTDVIDGETELINNINGVDADQIEPIPGCAPLKCYVNGKPTMVIGLNRGMLLFNFANDAGEYIQHNFFEATNAPTSPTLCGQYIVFTSKRGDVFALNIGTKPFKMRCLSTQKISFSAPVSLNGLVYFEALSDSGNRSLARFDPNSGQLSKAVDIDSEPEHSFENRRTLFIHPPLTNGKRVFLSDRSGQSVYTYDSDRGASLPIRRLPENDSQYQFAPHQSIVVNNRIYSAHSYGLTILPLGQNNADQHRSLAMGQPTNPTPVARPIRYGDKLFILCKDRLLCLNY